MPFRKSRLLSASERAAHEARVCFVAAVGCIAIGGAGELLNWFGSLDTSLPAFAVVGCFYVLMGLGRWWKWTRLRAGRVEAAETGH